MRKAISICFLILASSLSSSGHPGISIVCDDQGNVYFTDLEHVWRIDPSGDVSIAVKNIHTHQLLLDEIGSIHGEHVWYIENGDLWAHYLWQLKNSGEFLKITGDIMEFPENNYLVRDRHGSSYYSERVGEKEHLIRKKRDGNKELVSEEDFTDIRWIQYSKNRNSLLVVDHTSLKEVCLDGKVKLIKNDFGSNSPAFSWVNDRHKIMGVWTDNGGNIYTSVFGSQKVVIMDSEGEVLDQIKVNGLWSPSGGVFDKDRNLWLLEYSVRNNARVRKISPDGNILEFYPKS